MKTKIVDTFMKRGVSPNVQKQSQWKVLSELARGKGYIEEDGEMSQ